MPYRYNYNIYVLGIWNENEKIYTFIESRFDIISKLFAIDMVNKEIFEYVTSTCTVNKKNAYSLKKWT